ncbi:MAG: Rpn family recombination-promoting nuclease/putative transposase [Leptolyngbyaceae cyanobacterium CSU_1_3]|nr:Rpn family recombination-promoting nuclease/putative transposase [Leptolyngbyaceae cyanobacterium CSU_1_3]
MSFDNLCKLLAEKHPRRFATWILGTEPDTIEVLKTELSIEPIRADSVTFLQTSGRILHLEFQTQWTSNPPMPLRLLDYWVRLHRLYRSPVTQVVVLLLPPSEETAIETAFELESTRHEYQVVKMWEQDPETFLNDPALLPLATLTRTQNPTQLLNQVAQHVAEIEADDRPEISAYVQLMAGLKYDKNEVRRIFREGIMRESVIYQEIWQEGEQVGEARGEARGRLEVARNLLLEGMTIDAIARVTGLSIEQIQQLQTTQNP